MSSKPLISAEVGSGTSHVNIDGLTGIVVAAGSSLALRAAMDKLYHNKASADEMGKNARRRYETLFTGRLMGQRYAQMYAEVLSIKIEKEPPGDAPSPVQVEGPHI
jgi:glycosyltransferase involved in cell wall biosynthesis